MFTSSDGIIKGKVTGMDDFFCNLFAAFNVLYKE